MAVRKGALRLPESVSKVSAVAAIAVATLFNRIWVKVGREGMLVKDQEARVHDLFYGCHVRKFGRLIVPSQSR
jgi:hypothetical protein